MFQRFFSYDGKLMEFLNKLGEIILVNIVFLLCCMPIVTTGPALTSFYYAMVKSVRRERGGPIKEFMNSMKRTLGRGVLLTIGTLVWMTLLYLGRQMVQTGAENAVNITTGATGAVTLPVVLYDVAILISICILIYLFPVFSRFEMKLSGMIKLSFVMGIRFLPITFLIAAGSAVIGWLLLYRLPIACVLAVPGIWCYVITFPMEKVLKRYMPEAKPGEEQWYDE